jgi:hypothetical protein
MVTAFSVASWNVEHFKQGPERIKRIIDFMNCQTPDVFALYEVEGSEVFQSLVSQMHNYTFHITEGPQVQEILLGVRHGLTAFFTQKLEFKGGVTTLRPGALLTITISNTHYPLLFLHTASGNNPRGLGLRDDMLIRACKFRKVLDKAGGDGRANYIFLGDLNTMGMVYHYVKGKNISPDDELTKLDRQAKRYDMRFLKKDVPATWSNGSTSSIPPSNLDHVIAANHLRFTPFGDAEVSARGWPKEPTPAEQDQWIHEYSDHALLYFEVHRVS